MAGGMVRRAMTMMMPTIRITTTTVSAVKQSKRR